MIQFLFNHWQLFVALVVALSLIGINEWFALQQQAPKATPARAVDLINHSDAVVFDLRETTLFQNGHIINAISAHADDFNKPGFAKYKNQCVILVCAQGHESQTLALNLKKQGFNQTMVLSGGMASWQAEHLPLVKGKK